MDDINSVEYLPTGSHFCSGSDDRSCRIFDTRKGVETQEFGTEGAGITSVAVTASGRHIFCGTTDDEISCYDATLKDLDKDHNGEIFRLHAAEGRVSCIGISDSGDALCTGSWDCLLKIWA